MNLRRYILSFIFVLTFGNAFATIEVIYLSKATLRNVKVEVLTKSSIHNEESGKIFLLGEIAAYFAKQLNYSDTIFLDFTYCYWDNCEPNYFISYDKGKKCTDDYHKTKSKNSLKNNAIVIRQVAEQFDAQTTLKLLEYAILNKKNIKSSQQTIKYRQKKFNSIDTTLIKQLLNMPNSSLIDSVLNLKFRKCEDINSKSEISYYLQNNKYTIFAKQKKTEINLLTLDNIYHFKRINDSTAIVFDTDTSFYFIDKHKISKRQTFQTDFQSFDMSTTCMYNERKIVIWLRKRYTLNDIFFSYGLSEVKILVYSIEEDELFQDAKTIGDIDELINKK